MKPLQKIFIFCSLVALIASCAPIMQPPLEPLDNSTAKSTGGKYVPKVNNFQVILDSSLSMDEWGPNQFLAGRKMASRINQGIPTDLKYNGGLRSFGHHPAQSSNPTDLIYGMTNYTRAGFHDALGTIRYTGGLSPLGAALEGAGNDLKSAPGKSALIVISDGLHMDDAPAAAEKVKGMLGDVCIYTVAIGNNNNGAGHDLLKKVAESAPCGGAMTEADLASDAQMAAFIEEVFLAKPAPKPVVQAAPAPRDSDGDGVFDDRDKCPNTPRGEFVDENGCTLKLTLHINFDFDKSEIKPEFKPDLDRAAEYIKRYSQVPYILIAGHTDHSGTEEYNQTLSEDRANAVRQYLIDNYGIDGNRLSAKGYGKMKPIADNTSKEGRAQNRRVEIVCCTIKLD